MDQIRSFTAEDIPQVADLFQKIFRGSDLPAPVSLRSYFKEFYFEHPWYDPSLPSYVFETTEGKIAGFIGIMPFRMLYRGEKLTAAVGGNYMVDPGLRNPLAGVRLLKRFLDGPQDLSMTDTATDQARKIWEGLGGKTCQLFSMHWTRILRPGRFALTTLASKSGTVARMKFAAAPVCSLLDAVLSKVPRSPFLTPRTEETGVELSAATLLEGIDAFSRERALRPAYDLESLSWILRMLERKTEFGVLSKVAVHDLKDNLLGWYMFFPNTAHLAPVVQVGARKDSIGRVFDHLLAQAWGRGSTAIEGRLEPKFVKEYSYKYSMFYQGGRYIMIHSRRSELIQSVLCGDAFLSRLEGEWWTRFQGDTFE